MNLAKTKHTQCLSTTTKKKEKKQSVNYYLVTRWFKFVVREYYQSLS